MIRLSDILSKVETYHPGADADLIKRAYVFAAKAHDGQMRRSGDPYVVHPLSVASIITDLRLDVPSVCAGLLHDCVEDTSVTVDELGQVFSPEVAFLVDGVTKLGKIPWSTREERQAENFRKMLLAMARDIRVILVKLADRLDNMRTMEHMPPEKQERIARETMDIYAPLANRLGIMWIKCELEDLAFKYLEPVEHENLRVALAKTEKERHKYITEVEKLIHKEMEAGGVPCVVKGRAKHLWSIHQKMKKTGGDLGQIHDAIGFRVITDSVRQCYEALGVAHSRWTPIPGRFKDYIALPKPNMYQSLHTTVMGPYGQRIEIQIRTAEMHKVAEDGIAAHWRYKEGKPALIADKDERKFSWLRQLMEWQQDLQDPTEFIETVKIDLFSDEVYVFTPKGDVKALPKGATPIDFAYAVHTEVGNKCSGARVNGAIVPLRYQLRNGDTIEIITNPGQKPNKDWLKLAVTSRAKTKIRHLLRTEQRERARTLGRDLLERELRKWGISLGKTQKNGELDKAVNVLRTGTQDDLIALVGYGKLTTAQVIDVLVPEERRLKGPSEEPPPSGNPITNLFRRVTRRVVSQPTGIVVAGEGDILVRYAKCCSPLPGDAIVGFITRGRGVTVHTRDCQKALDLDPERRVDVTWDGKSKARRPVSIQVVCADKPGILAVISQSFTDAGVNISQAHCRATDDNKAVNTFSFNVQDLDQLKSVIRSIQKINGVFSVERIAAPA
ncbi:MAG TPA: bifunctional (p)ppGpp synthetase/guanosine-3',5'-bis(diphosphate) 3'-pyrophosphohydrolase [Haliangiales bacterium]|nr:bifunctional (p)ppGpp synthetase/guanosine-3',5'-bis(diphosphate) 3'-pyrophosphohydrolase [Haliangiales bacterium]